MAIRERLGPILYGVEGLLIGDVIHQDEAHGSAVIGRCDGTVPLLAGCVPYLQLYSLLSAENSFHLEK